MTILFTIPGLGGWPSLVLPYLNGEFRPGHTLPNYLGGQFGPVTRYVGVNNWWPSHGMRNLDKALNTAPADEQRIVMGHSMGALAIVYWFRQYAPTSSIDPDNTLFITMGAKLKDAVAHDRYRTIDVTAQWEYVADYPDVRCPEYLQAERNAKVGNTARGGNLHSKGYVPISLDAQHWEARKGNCTYMLFETPEVPLKGGVREDIEKAYGRDYLADAKLIT